MTKSNFFVSECRNCGSTLNLFFATDHRPLVDIGWSMKDVCCSHPSYLSITTMQELEDDVTLEDKTDRMSFIVFMEGG